MSIKRIGRAIRGLFRDLQEVRALHKLLKETTGNV